VREVLEKMAFQPQSSSPERLRVLVAEQMQVWTKLGKDAGITPQ
jgi:hypothetical protein